MAGLIGRCAALQVTLTPAVPISLRAYRPEPDPSSNEDCCCPPPEFPPPCLSAVYLRVSALRLRARVSQLFLPVCVFVCWFDCLCDSPCVCVQPS